MYRRRESQHNRLITPASARHDRMYRRRESRYNRLAIHRSDRTECTDDVTTDKTNKSPSGRRGRMQRMADMANLWLTVRTPHSLTTRLVLLCLDGGWISRQKRRIVRCNCCFDPNTNRFKRTLIQYADFRGNPLYQATKRKVKEKD